MRKITYLACMVCLLYIQDGFSSRSESDTQPVPVRLSEREKTDLQQIVNYTVKRYGDAFRLGGNIHEIGDLIFGFKPKTIGDPRNHNLERDNAQVILKYLQDTVNEGKAPTPQDWGKTLEQIKTFWQQDDERLLELCELNGNLEIRSTYVGRSDRWSDDEMRCLMEGAPLSDNAKSVIDEGVVASFAEKITRSDIITCYGYMDSKTLIWIDDSKLPVPKELTSLVETRNSMRCIPISKVQEDPKLLPLALEYKIKTMYSNLDDEQVKTLVEIIIKLSERVNLLNGELDERNRDMRIRLAQYYADYFLRLLNCEITGFDDQFNNGGDSDYYSTLQPLIVLAWKFAESKDGESSENRNLFSMSLLENVGLNRGEACYPGIRNRALIWICLQLKSSDTSISEDEYKAMTERYEKEYESATTITPATSATK